MNRTLAALLIATPLLGGCTALRSEQSQQARLDARLQPGMDPKTVARHARSIGLVHQSTHMLSPAERTRLDAASILTGKSRGVMWPPMMGEIRGHGYFYFDKHDRLQRWKYVKKDVAI